MLSVAGVATKVTPEGETDKNPSTYGLAMRPQAECYEVLDDAVRAALEEIADPAGAAARAAAAGIKSKNVEVNRRDDDDSEEDGAPTWHEGVQPAGFRIGPNGELEWTTEAEAEAVVHRAIREAMVAAGWRRDRTLH
jgi:hypothetical protein